MVVCVVVNWNGWQDTLACLNSLEEQTVKELQIVVVDNGSSDNSVARIREYLARRDPAAPAGMKLLETNKNLGFSGGNNAGMRAAAACNPDFYWLLNNDTIAPPDTLELLQEEAARDPQVGIVGSVLYYEHDPTKIQAWGGGHINASIAYSRHFVAPRALASGDYITFASVLLRRKTVDAVGSLSEAFFMYMEDAEMCLRAQKAGWKLAVAAKTRVLHAEGGSRKGKRPSLFLERVLTRSGLELIRQHGHLPVVGPAFFVGSRVVNRLRRGQWRAAAAALSGAFGRQTVFDTPNALVIKP